MDKRIALNEIMLYDALKRRDSWYLEKKTGHLSFITTEERNIGIVELPKEEYVECPYCGPYMAKEYILARQFEQSLLDEYGIDPTLNIAKYLARYHLDSRVQAFVCNVGRMCHDLGFVSDYRRFYRPLMETLAIEWLNEIQSFE